MQIPLVFASIVQDKPNTNYGQTATIKTQSGEQAALGRYTLPADISESAVVTKGDIVLHTRSAMGSTRDLTARALSAGFQVARATWDNAPTQTGTSYTETVGAISADAEIRIDIIGMAQGHISGAAVNRGFRLQSSEATSRSWYGPKAGKFQPYLDLEYLEPGDAPTDLSPAGAAVSIAKPTLIFVTAPGTTAIQVQIDAAEDGVSPDFDSGEVPATAGVLDLTRTDLPGGTYAGLSAGATTSWRARSEDSLGWTAWSDWVSFPRTAKTTVTITSPGSTTGDPTPPVTWTAADQESWQAWLRDGVTGALLATSGLVTSADQVWVPPKGMRQVGDTAVATVHVFDDVDRIASPGDPVYAVATQLVTLVAADAAAGVSTLTVTVDPTKPFAHLAWTGAAADDWQIVRAGKWVERIDGTLFEYDDYGASGRAPLTYKVLRVSNGAVSPNGPSVTVSMSPMAAWLVDPETGDAIMMVDHDVEVFMEEQAVIHTVLDAPPVRRRVGTPPPSGAVSGQLVDGVLSAAGLSAAEMHANALSFKGEDQDKTFRLVWADQNYPVNIGNLTSEAYNDGDHTVSYKVGFTWWHTGDEPWGV